MMFGLGPIEIFLVLIILGFAVTVPIGLVLIFLHARKGATAEGVEVGAAPAATGPNCPKCSAPVAANAKFCAQCGEGLSPRTLF